MLQRVTICITLLSVPGVDIARGQEVSVTNLGLAGNCPRISGDWFVGLVGETSQGEDLNGDGDLEDGVPHVRNLITGEKRNLRLAAATFFCDDVFLSGRWFVFWVPESRQREDLNGDGDIETDEEEGGYVVHVHDLVTGETRNLGLHAYEMEISGHWLGLTVGERRQGRDLNGDGDTDDSVLHVHDLESGETTNLGLAGGNEIKMSLGKWLVFRASEAQQGEDFDGDGWIGEDHITHVIDVETGETTNTGLTSRWSRLSERWFVSKTRGNVLYVHDLATGDVNELGLAVDQDLAGNWVRFQVHENHRREDLNGDGDTEDEVAHIHNLETGTTRNLGFPAGGFVSGDWFVARVSEAKHGQDLNGDGDREDLVELAHNFETGKTKDLDFSRVQRISGKWLIAEVSELERDEDLNGDGEVDDDVLYVHNLQTHETRNLELTAETRGPWGQWLVVQALESQHGVDFNDDGDAADEVLHVHDLENGVTRNLGLAGGMAGWRLDGISQTALVLGISETQQGVDLNRDGDLADTVLHVHDLGRGETENLALDLALGDYGTRFCLSGNWVAFGVSESGQGVDLNGDGTLLGAVLHVADLSSLQMDVQLLRGDCDADGEACSGVGDALTLLSWLFRGDTRPPCIAACDIDGNGETELTDAVYGLDYCFSGTAPPPGPFPGCGAGTEGDVALGCTSPPASCP